MLYNLIWERDIKEGINNTIDYKILSSKQSLNRHLLICKGVYNPFECHLCDYSSKWKHLKTCKNKDITTTNVNELIETNNENE
jgi:hypothetical protein